MNPDLSPSKLQPHTPKLTTVDEGLRAQIEALIPPLRPSAGFVLLAVLLFWAMGGFGELGLSGKGVVALTLGFLFTAGLAIGLMAPVFFSDRSGRDDETNRAAER